MIKDKIRIAIDREKCKGCLLCISVCPRSLLEKEAGLNARGVYPVRCVDSDRCIGCVRCALMCPDCCIEIEKI